MRVVVSVLEGQNALQLLGKSVVGLDTDGTLKIQASAFRGPQ